MRVAVFACCQAEAIRLGDEVDRLKGLLAKRDTALTNLTDQVASAEATIAKLDAEVVEQQVQCLRDSLVVLLGAAHSIICSRRCSDVCGPLLTVYWAVC